MLAIFWIFVFILSVALLVKSADWFTESAEKIGLALKISPFIIGVTIVAIGTSLPELASSLAAVFKGKNEIVAANVIGSNIFNMLFIVGLSAVVARMLTIRRSLIDLDAPLLACSTILFLFAGLDKKIVFGEGVLLFLGFLVYLLYTIYQKREPEEEETGEFFEVLPSRIEKKEKRIKIDLEKRKDQKLTFRVFFFLILGVLGLVFASDYTIESLTKVSQILGIPTSVIAIIALAGGTSLPELVVSIRAAAQKKYEISLGNIFGSNVFNILTIISVSSFFSSLTIDEITFSVGFPFLVVATFLFIISGISRRIHVWEGAMYLLIYCLFFIKLWGVF